MNKINSKNKSKYDIYAIWLYNELKRNQKPSSYYFITITFKKNSVNRQRRSTEGCPESEFEFDGFNLLYNRVCRKFIGRNYQRHYNQINLPTVIACIDVEGTRFGKSPVEIENKHIHSVWKIPSDNQEAFEKFIKGYKLKTDLKNMIDSDGFDIQNINPSDLKNVVTYSPKFLKFNVTDMRVEEDLRIYPYKPMDLPLEVHN